MVDKTSTRLKVVWLCHFSNQQIQEYLKPWKQIPDFAPWITNLISVFENKSEIDLHIVAPYTHITRNKSFILNGIHYHFFNSGIPCIGKNYPRWFPWSFWTRYKRNHQSIVKIISGIKPDLIHLHGAENAYFTGAILRLYKTYPVFTTLQGFLCSCDIGNDKVLQYRVKIELEIYQKLKHFGVRTQSMSDYMHSLNPRAKLHWHQYNLPDIPCRCNNPLYDIVFFARISKHKGIEDLLQAVSLVKKQKPDVSALICGTASREYQAELEQMVAGLDIKQNVIWAGYVKTQSELFEKASRAKLSVLPTHKDMIPGTIIESMLMEIPVITYNAGSIPEINSTGEYVLMHEIGDIKGLAASILDLLNNEEKRVSLAKKARTRALELWSNESVYSDIMNAYKSVVNDFYKAKEEK